jgi:hypothetical protein
MAFWDDVVDAVSDVVDVVADVVTDVADVAGDVVEAGADAVGDVVSTTLSTAAHVFLPFIPDEIIDTATDVIGGLASTAVNFAADAVVGLGESVTDVVEGVVTGDLGMIAGAGLSLAGGIAFGPIGASVGQLAGNVLGSALGDGDVVGGIAAGVGGMLGGPLGSTVGSAVGGLLTGEGGIEGVVGAAAKGLLGEAGGDVGSWMQDAIPGVDKVVEGFGDALSGGGLGGLTGAAVSYATQAATSFVPTPLRQMATGFNDGLVDLDASSMGGFLGTAIDDGPFGSAWDSPGDDFGFGGWGGSDFGDLGIIGSASEFDDVIPSLIEDSVPLLRDDDDVPLLRDDDDVALLSTTVEGNDDGPRGILPDGLTLRSDGTSVLDDDFDAPLNMGAAAIDLDGGGGTVDLDDVMTIGVATGAVARDVSVIEDFDAPAAPAPDFDVAPVAEPAYVEPEYVAPEPTQVSQAVSTADAIEESTDDLFEGM